MKAFAPARRRSAFTLIEVVVAIAIFAIAAIMLGSAYVGVLESYEAASKGRQRDEDMRFARQLLLAEADVKKAAEGADFETPDRRRVRWSATITPTAMPDLFQVEFLCETQDGAGQRSSTETFTLLRPSWSEAGERDKLRQELRLRIQELSTGKKP
jgi:general secretion pathway protein I